MKLKPAVVLLSSSLLLASCNFSANSFRKGSSEDLEAFNHAMDAEAAKEVVGYRANGNVSLSSKLGNTKQGEIAITNLSADLTMGARPKKFEEISPAFIAKAQADVNGSASTFLYVDYKEDGVTAYEKVSATDPLISISARDNVSYMDFSRVKDFALISKGEDYPVAKDAGRKWSYRGLNDLPITFTFDLFDDAQFRQFGESYLTFSKTGDTTTANLVLDRDKIVDIYTAANVAIWMASDEARSLKNDDELYDRTLVSVKNKYKATVKGVIEALDLNVSASYTTAGIVSASIKGSARFVPNYTVNMNDADKETYEGSLDLKFETRGSVSLANVVTSDYPSL